MFSELVPLLSKCNTLAILYNDRFNIPEHSRVRLLVQLWKIDSWDNEWLYINVDGVRLWERQLGFSNGGRPICGSANANWNELILDVDEIFEHTEPKLIVQFTATINQDAADGHPLIFPIYPRIMGIQRIQTLLRAQGIMRHLLHRMQLQGNSLRILR